MEITVGKEIIICVLIFVLGIAVLVIIRAFSRNDVVIVLPRPIHRNSRMSQDDIKKLPSFNYMVEEQEKEKEISSGGDGSGSSSPLEMECAVCLENFKVGEMCRLLPKCNHCFHAECIDSWLLKTAVCPICRTEAISPSLGGYDRNQFEIGVELV